MKEIRVKVGLLGLLTMEIKHILRTICKFCVSFCSCDKNKVMFLPLGKILWAAVGYSDRLGNDAVEDARPLVVKTLLLQRILKRLLPAGKGSKLWVERKRWVYNTLTYILIKLEKIFMFCVS